MNKKNLLKMD